MALVVAGRPQKVRVVDESALFQPAPLDSPTAFGSYSRKDVLRPGDAEVAVSMRQLVGVSLRTAEHDLPRDRMADALAGYHAQFCMPRQPAGTRTFAQAVGDHVEAVMVYNVRTSTGMDVAPPTGLHSRTVMAPRECYSRAHIEYLATLYDESDELHMPCCRGVRCCARASSPRRRARSTCTTARWCSAPTCRRAWSTAGPPCA